MEPTTEQTYKRRIAELEAENAELKAQVALLSERVAKLSKDSSNSSKPPSSDIVKPPKPTPKGKRKNERRKIGGQKGHPKHDRQPFAVEDLNDAWEYHLDCCPSCGGRLKRAEDKARVVQQVEVVESPIRIDEHRGLAYYCRRCRVEGPQTARVPTFFLVPKLPSYSGGLPDSMKKYFFRHLSLRFGENRLFGIVVRSKQGRGL